MAFVNNQLESANLTSVSLTLANSRPSFRGALTTGNTAGSSIITINTTPGAYPSTSSAQLVEGDVLRIGEIYSLGSYTVASTSSNAVISLTSSLAAGDADSGDDVVASSSGSLTVRFTTVSAITDGGFRILVPALSSDTASADGIPDGGFFDFGQTAPTITCPTNLTGYTFSAGAAAASTVTIGSTDYHAYTCEYTGAGAVSTAFDGTTNGAIVVSSVINPAPKTNHTIGTADTYNIIVQHLDTSDVVVDSTTAGLGVIEAVRVTATIPPQISFRIIGLAAGTSACGVTTNVLTTPAAVPFGEISIDAFTNAAHSLAVSTNATNGYIVTALENDQLGRNGGACAGDPTTSATCIRDTAGNGGAMTHTASAEWTNASTAKGFGYSLHDVNGTTTEAFAYTTATGNCTGTYCARQFADADGDITSPNEAPVSIFSGTTVADNHNLYVCYRIVASVTNASGNYENFVVYRATATF